MLWVEVVRAISVRVPVFDRVWRFTGSDTSISTFHARVFLRVCFKSYRLVYGRITPNNVAVGSR